MVADRPPQHRIAGLEGVENRPRRYRRRDVERDFRAGDLRQRSQMRGKDDTDHAYLKSQCSKSKSQANAKAQCPNLQYWSLMLGFVWSLVLVIWSLANSTPLVPRAASRQQFQLRQGFPQLLDGLGRHLGAAHVQFLKVLASCQLFQPRIGDATAAQIEQLQVRQPGQFLEADVRYATRLPQ